MGQIAFVVWRETVEALLVIGVLNAWLTHRAVADRARSGRLYLWAGVVAGIAGAVGLGIALLFFADIFGDEGEDYFQAVMVLVAAGLIVQMVNWSHQHGRSLKAHLEQGMDSAAQRSNWWGIFVLAAIAVAREGSETAVFLYGNLAAAAADTLPAALGAAGLGFLAAIATYGLLQVGGRVLSWRLFFRVTGIMLLLLAAALVMTGVDRLIGLGVLSSLTPPLWDTGSILDDSGMIGGLVSSLTGYRARPDLMQLLVYSGFWVVVWLVTGDRRPRPAVEPT